MKIVLVWQSSYPWEVRIEKFTDALLQQGHEVTVLCRHKGEAHPEEVLRPGVRVIRVGFGQPVKLSVPVSANPLWYRALCRVIDAARPDLLIVRDLPLAELAARAGRSRSVPVVMDMAEHYPGAMRGWKKYNTNPVTRFMIHTLKAPDWVERRAVGLMDGIITVCDEQIERLNKSYGYPVAKMRVVNNSPKRGWFAGARKGISDRPQVFGHHGHMTPERGLTLLLEAFAQVASERPDVQLHLAGGGEAAEDIQAAIDRLGIECNVQNFGRFQHSDLDRLYGSIDIAVLPYPPNEIINHTLSNKIFDYMACGKPLITSGAGPMKRLITNTGAGLYFEPWTAGALAKTMLAALNQDLRICSERGMSAFRETFHWETDAINLLSFLSAIPRRET
jgi:glycosyltransferase involved in cell wall biosynthesis